MYSNVDSFIEERIRFFELIVENYINNEKNIPEHQKREAYTNYHESKQLLVFFKEYKEKRFHADVFIKNEIKNFILRMVSQVNTTYIKGIANIPKSYVIIDNLKLIYDQIH